MKRKSCTSTSWENSLQSSNHDMFFKYPPVLYRNPIGSRLLFQSHHFSGANCHVKLWARNTPKTLVHFLVCSRWHPQRDDGWLLETNFWMLHILTYALLKPNEASLLIICWSNQCLDTKILDWLSKQLLCGRKTATTNGQSCILFCPEDSGTVKPLCKNVDIKINWSS